ncbi:hypothetical protein RclHR1_10860002 [Rhizophagus clarus]|uniref:F-box domain-containing protein n=1 Tax=Rhizophagus clarus TaxID=94130 RepID=A0A2Z6Q797_9GLOM|nr:hypothetical protein RclHR1_10860002 [Rhizophagus clarus]GES91079.1 hypothetical protein GLOIN_2v1531010 [Rhizophagus clarus]
MSQLPADCLYEILEHLEDDQFTLYSCILVNRFWCEISVKIFWRDVYSYNTSKFKTLIACLPIESKKILHDNGIIISTSTSKFPTFNYATFCKVLFINIVYYRIRELLEDQKTISPQDLNNKTQIVVNEIFKMLMKQVTSLKGLFFSPYSNITFTLYPGAQNCLKNLSELRCNSNVSTELFYQLSQICYNIQIFSIEFRRTISSGLADLISVQRNLKCFYMTLYYDVTADSLTNTIPSLLSKLPNNLMKLDLYGAYHSLSLSFIYNLLDLQELHLTFSFDECIGDFKELQYVIFPQLQVLKIRESYPRNDLLTKFLEKNGKNLKEICIGEDTVCSDNSLNLSIARLCPNLKKISVGIKSSELETLKIIFNCCENLESIKIWCGKDYLNEKEALEAIVKYSRNIDELILYHQLRVQYELLPEELESFFINWTDCKSQKSISLVVVNYDANSLDKNYENIEIINKYIKLGVVRKFKVTDFDDEEYN